MKRNGIINWSENKLTTIKRDLLFFDTLSYEESLFNLHCDSIKLYINDNRDDSSRFYLDELYSTISYLEHKNVLNGYDGIELKKRYYESDPDKQIMVEIAETLNKLFHKGHIEDLSSLIKNNTSKDEFYKLKDKLDIHTEIGLRSDSSDFNKIQNENLHIPIVDKFHPDVSRLYSKSGQGEFNEESNKEQQVIKLALSNIPIPNGKIPFDEILDFRNDLDNKRRYMGLTNWITDISKSSFNIHEIKDKIEYMTVDFEAYMETQKYQYETTSLEVFVKLPLEIVERFVKGEWSKLDESYLKVESNKVKLLAAEMNAPSRELAYIIKAKEKFKK